MRHTPAPKEIRRLNAQAIQIHWSTGEVHKILSENLRKQCPCAQCKEERGEINHDQPLSPSPKSLRIVEHTADESLQLESIWAVGNYAVGCRWADGHSTGIYTYGFLYELGGS